jgi:hypothetical protein
LAEWFEGLDPEHLEHATAKGWNKPLTPEIATGIVQAHRAAEKLIGTDPSLLLKLPKDASDPTYQSAYDRIVGMSVPKTPEEYKFDGIRFKNGSEFDADDQQFIRGLATKYKLPAAVARGIAEEMVGRAEANFDATNGQNETAKAGSMAALRGTWGADYDKNAFAASQAVDALKELGLAVPTGEGLDAPNFVKHMDGLVRLGAQLREANILRGSNVPRDETAGMNAEQARAHFDELKGNREWITKALTPGTAEGKVLQNLQRIMAQGRVAA